MNQPNPTAPALSVAEATDAQFWRTLCPDLTVGGGAAAPDAVLGNPAGLLNRLQAEGYINEPGVFPGRAVERLRAALQVLEARGIPPVFVFVYDEFWLIFRSLDPFLQSVLGPDYRILPDCWAWFVRPSNDTAGWKPHRDRAAAPFQRDALPESLTVWLPLTDATPLNGCIHVIPAHWDEAIGDPGAEEPKEFSLSDTALQNIRALPAPAGSLLAWNQHVLHWGGRSSARAPHPRCSLALQFQRGDRPPLAEPLLDPRALLPFRARLGLIGRLIRGYAYFNVESRPGMQVLAAALDWSFWPQASAADGSRPS